MTIILVAHIVLMSLSLIGTVAIAVASLVRRTVNDTAMSVNVGVTTCGIAAGIALLTSGPITMRCAVLIAYVAAFSAITYAVRKRNQSLVLVES